MEANLDTFLNSVKERPNVIFVDFFYISSRVDFSDLFSATKFQKFFEVSGRKVYLS